MGINSRSYSSSCGSCRPIQHEYTTAVYAECPSKVVGARGLHPVCLLAHQGWSNYPCREHLLDVLGT